MARTCQRNDSVEIFPNLKKEIKKATSKIVAFSFNTPPTYYAPSQSPYPYKIVHNEHSG